MTAELTIDLRSTGQLAADFRVPHKRIVEAIEAAKARARLTLNGLQYFDGDAQEAIAAALKLPPTKGPR